MQSYEAPEEILWTICVSNGEKMKNGELKILRLLNRKNAFEGQNGAECCSKCLKIILTKKRKIDISEN